MKQCAVLLETWGCYPSLRSSRKTNPTLSRFQGNPLMNWLRYWWKCVVLLETWGCYPSLRSSRKTNPTLWWLSRQSIKNRLRYWWKCAVLLETWGCYPSLRSSRKTNPTLWRFQGNPLRIDWDIDENVQFYSKHGVVTPHCDRLEKLTQLCDKAIR